MNPTFLSRARSFPAAAPLLFLFGSLVASLATAHAAEPSATSRSPAPNAPAARAGRPDFWSPTAFNHADTFDNRGIATYRHATLASRKLHFNGAAETEVGYTVYLPPGYDSGTLRYPVVYDLHGLTGSQFEDPQWSCRRSSRR